MTREDDKWVGRLPGAEMGSPISELVEAVETDAKKTIEHVMDIDTAYRRMFSELNRKSVQTYSLRSQLLKKEKAQYFKATQDKLLV